MAVCVGGGPIYGFFIAFRYRLMNRLAIHDNISEPTCKYMSILNSKCWSNFMRILAQNFNVHYNHKLIALNVFVETTWWLRCIETHLAFF